MPGYIESHLSQAQQYPPLAERKVAMFDEGKRYADQFLNRSMAHQSDIDPTASKAEMLSHLRESVRELREQIQAGQLHHGSAWQDPDFTRGARYELNHRYYLQMKWEMGLTHLPEMGQKFGREHTQKQDRDYELSY